MKLALIAFVLLIAGCATAGSADGVQVRVANRSTTTFDRVVIGFVDQQEEYGAIPPSGATAYRMVRRAYRYGYVEVHMGPRRLTMQPIDYVGETPLAPGRYTYALSLSPTGENLVLALEEDE